MSFPPQAYCELHGVPLYAPYLIRVEWTTVLTLDLAPPELPFLRVFPRGTGIGASQVVPVQTVTSRPSVQTSPGETGASTHSPTWDVTFLQSKSQNKCQHHANSTVLAFR